MSGVLVFAALVLGLVLAYALWQLPRYEEGSREAE